MIDLIKLLTRKKESSKDVAKERLKLVLIHDRSNVSPQFLEMVKSEIIKVIQNYMDIDEDTLDIQLTKTNSDDGERVVPALVANIPIKGMKNAGRSL
ncbi:MAG: cell division topological specificity factor MinE [Clostridiaceae bacterium]|nr:cell division topological specificity factor MinE [Clostridiaceae bacterium]